jgi:hypothetical protein
MHKLFFKLLKGLPCDATFDQLGSVSSFAQEGHKDLYSFDLKAATDTIPYLLYEPLVAAIVGSDIAKAWLSLLRDRPWKLPSWAKDQGGKQVSYPLIFKDEDGVKQRSVCYGRGQPMGALSSWGALALLHHAIVQYSAFLVGQFPFEGYRVLGDDVVIAGRAVARSYKETCDLMGVKIGLAKSFVSTKGFFNFAAQSYIGSKNVSPISLKQELSRETSFDALTLVLAAIQRGWLDVTSRNFFQRALRFMVPPTTYQVVEAHRKKGQEHEAATVCSAILFQYLLEEVSPTLLGLEVTCGKFLSSGLLHPGLGIFTHSIAELSSHNLVTDWGSRHVLGLLIWKQIEKLERVIESIVERCEELSPTYGFLRFLWPNPMIVPGKGEYDVSLTLPLLERIGEKVAERLDLKLLEIAHIRGMVASTRFSLHEILLDHSFDDLVQGYRILLQIEKDVSGLDLSSYGLFNRDSTKSVGKTFGFSIIENLALSDDVDFLQRSGMNDYGLLEGKLGYDLMVVQRAVGLWYISQSLRSPIVSGS